MNFTTMETICFPKHMYKQANALASVLLIVLVTEFCSVLFVFVLCLVCPMLPVSLDCLRPVSCVPNVASVSGLSSSCVLCAQCCQCLWIVNPWLLLPFSLTFIYHGRLITSKVKSRYLHRSFLRIFLNIDLLFSSCVCPFHYTHMLTIIKISTW